MRPVVFSCIMLSFNPLYFFFLSFAHPLGDPFFFFCSLSLRFISIRFYRESWEFFRDRPGVHFGVKILPEITTKVTSYQISLDVYLKYPVRKDNFFLRVKRSWRLIIFSWVCSLGGRHLYLDITRVSTASDLLLSLASRSSQQLWQPLIYPNHTNLANLI